MRLPVLTALIIALLSPLYSQSQDKGVVVSKITATWCPNCGNWGWDYFEALRDIYSSNPEVCLLGVHHSGDLLNPVSNWFSGNLENSYQPEFYVNNEQIDVLGFNWNAKLEDTQEEIMAQRQQSVFADFDFTKAYTDNGNILCSVSFGPGSKSDGDYYFAVYVFENNVANFQSSRGMAMHPNVLRDVMSDNYYGELYATSNQSTGSRTDDFEIAIQNDWNPDELGLLAIMWKQEGGSYRVDNARAIYNLSLLSSSDDISSGFFDMSYQAGGLSLRSEIAEDIQFEFYSPSGQLLESSRFRDQHFLDTSAYPAGIYLLSLRSGSKLRTLQVAVF